MSEPARRRIDVSAETHAMLDTEARRRGLTVRDLIDRIVLDMAEWDTRADASRPLAGGRQDAAAAAPLMTQIGTLVGRFDMLVVRLADDLPTTIAKGFDAIKDTIVKTGGTGHLRVMLTEQDTAQTARLDAMHTAQETAGTEQAAAFASLHTDLGAGIDTLRREIVFLRRWHKERRWAAGMGAAGMTMLLVVLALLLADTAPTRWFAVRLTGNVRAVDAAFTLVGDGRASGKLMAETRGLLGDPDFRNDYTRCVGHAREVKKTFQCRVTMPPIITVER